MRIYFLALLLAAAQDPNPAARVNYHAVTASSSPSPEPGAESTPIPSLVTGLRSPSDWKIKRRELVEDWRLVLGKLEPNSKDRRWFHRKLKPRVLSSEDAGPYTRFTLEIPLETDFWQPGLLLVPNNRGSGPFPAVIAWTSTTPDWRQPEEWWGAWLASRGVVVLTGWSHIRHYRDDSDYRSNVSEKVYARFGRWAGLSRMVWDIRQQARFLGSRSDVDPRRIAFMGFSLSAKAAVYAAAFAPELSATVAIDPHIAINGGTNYFAPWYLDWTRPFEDIATPQRTVLSLLKGNRTAPGFLHDHHELLALAAPRPFLLIGGSLSEDQGVHSDDLQSWGYVNRARDVYRLLGVPDNLTYLPTGDGHAANGPHITPAWQDFLRHHLALK